MQSEHFGLIGIVVLLLFNLNKENEENKDFGSRRRNYHC